MRSKFIVSVTFFLVAASSLCGQTESFAPIGARWFYRPYELTDINSKLYTFAVTKDTVLEGLPAREMACSQWINGQFQDFPNLNKYIHTDADAVFYWVDNHWELIFDFGALPGDTIFSKADHSGIFGGCLGPDPGETWNLMYRIDSVRVETIGGVPLRVQYVENLCTGDDCWAVGSRIVERIGAIETDFWWGKGTLCLTGGFPGYLRCYEDNLVQYVGNIGNTECGYVGTNELEAGHISVSPNPTHGITSLNFPPHFAQLDFKVLDCFGRVLEAGTVEKGSTSLQIDLQNQHSGFFFITFTSVNQSITYKILKK